MDLKVAWRIYKNKGPVSLSSAQRAAKQARNVLRNELSEQQWQRLGIAVDHAIFGCEGREEFDQVCKEIETEIKAKIT